MGNIEEIIELKVNALVTNTSLEKSLAFHLDTYLSASSRIEQLTPINFEHFRSQTCSGDASYGSWLHSCERPPLDAEYGLG